MQWRLLLSHVEVALGAAVLGAAFIGIPLARGRFVGLAVLGGAAALLVAATGAAVVALRLSRRMKLRLREAGSFASALARGDYRYRIVPGEPDEIGHLEEELNAMAASLEAAIADLRTLADRNRRLAEEAGRLASLEERTRIARDLHDTVNQQVFSLSMQTAAARRRLEESAGDPGRVAEAAKALAGVEELARSAHRQMRDLILQLRPTTLEQQGLGRALEDYTRAFAEKEGLAAQCAVEFEGRFDPACEEALFRILQEALNNVAKHAGAGRVEVGLRLQPAAGERSAGGRAPAAGPGHKTGTPRGIVPSPRVVLTVRDDGHGFDRTRPVRPTALGLRGLRERAASLGGRVRVESAPGRGTTVTAALPLRREPENGDEDAAGGGPTDAGPTDAGPTSVAPTGAGGEGI